MRGIKPIVDVARRGYSLDTLRLEEKNKAFSSEWISPKIFASKVFQRPSTISYSTDYSTVYPHNLGYVPSFMTMRYEYNGWSHVGSGQPIYGDDTFSIVNVDESKYLITLPAYTRKVLLVACLDPIISISPKEIVPPNYPSLLVADEQEDIESVHPKDLSLDSRFNSVKIVKAGRITLVAEAFSATYGSQRTEVTEAHNLGYVPYFLPRLPYGMELANLYDGWANIPSYIDLNGFTDMTILDDTSVAMQPSEYLTTFITKDGLTLRLDRWNYAALYDGSTTNYPERTLTLDYIMLEIPIGDEYDLLNG